MSETTGIDWLSEIDGEIERYDTDLIRAHDGKYVKYSDLQWIAEQAAQIALSRHTLTPKRVDDLAKGISEKWAFDWPDAGPDFGEGARRMANLIKQELEGDARTKQRNP